MFDFFPLSPTVDTWKKFPIFKMANWKIPKIK